MYHVLVTLLIFLYNKHYGKCPVSFLWLPVLKLIEFPVGKIHKLINSQNFVGGKIISC